MATKDDVRRIALSLPATSESEDRFAFSVRNKDKDKGFAWSWMERVEPKEPRVENLDVLAVRVANAAEKEMLLASDPETFFTEPHYHGFPAILIRLEAIDVDELAELLTDGWRCQAPRALVKAFDQHDGAP
jgi:hypothetical protein